jgi:hypothetical protein
MLRVRPEGKRVGSLERRAGRPRDTTRRESYGLLEREDSRGLLLLSALRV